jgi:hypothetical protein
MPDHDRCALTAAPDDHRQSADQLTVRQLDLYASQLERCLKALGTDAPIRADVQRELAAVRAEQDARAEAGGHHDPGRPHDVSGLTAGQLERARRELAANLALVRPDSPARVPILAHLSAIDTELAGRAGARPGDLPGTRFTLDPGGAGEATGRVPSSGHERVRYPPGAH